MSNDLEKEKASEWMQLWESNRWTVWIMIGFWLLQIIDSLTYEFA